MVNLRICNNGSAESGVFPLACWCRQQRCLALSFRLSVVFFLFFCLKSDSSLFCTLFLDPFDLFDGIGTVSLHCLACSFFLLVALRFLVTFNLYLVSLSFVCRNRNCKSVLLSFFLFASRSANRFSHFCILPFSCFLVLTPISVLYFILCPFPEIDM